MSNKVSAKNKKIYEEILQSYCDVCFTHFRKVPAKIINEGLQILVCSKCHCKAHKCCYDLNANQTIINNQIRQFICDKCSNSQIINKQCFICQQSDGALILTEQKLLVHAFCALYHNQIDIVSYTPKIRVQKSISYLQSTNICEICKKPNAFESCAYQNCKKTAHPYCAKKLYMKELMQNDEPKCWNHHLACAPSTVFNLSDQIIPLSLLKDTIQEQFKQVEENSPFQIPNKESIMKKVFNQYLTEAKAQKKNSKNMKRGGYSFLSCAEHQFTPHCICQGQTQNGDNMIQCQTCFTWYHTECIKQKNLPDSFSCMFCKNFYDLKKKIIDEVIGGKNENYELKCELPPKMTFMDIMWIIRAIDARIAKGNVPKMLKQLAKYPLRSSKMEKLIKIENKEKIQNLCEEFYHEFFFSEEQFKIFSPHPVLGFDQQNKPIKLEKNFQKNRELRDFINILRNFCQNLQIVDEFKSIEKQLDFKQEAISDSYEKIIELSKSQQKYQEVAILKIKAQAYSFLQIVKKVNSGSVITINQLQQSVRKANLIQNVPEYLIQPLIQKYQNIKNILENLKSSIQKDPYNLIEIKQTANKLINDFKIEPPVFYDLYLEQRNFINTLYFYYLKQNQRKIEAESSLKEKLDQLIQATTQQTFYCNEELTKNLNSFLELRLKAQYPNYAFYQLKPIIQNLQKKTIRNTLINLQGTSILKKQKIQYLFEKFLHYNIRDQVVLDLIAKYQQILKAFKEITQIPLESQTSINSLRILHESCITLLESLDKFPIKIQQDGKNNKSVSWTQIIKLKKQEAFQLLTLAQESQFAKNPLTINKLLQSLPKQNPLVKNYRQLKKQQQEITSSFVSLLALCTQKTQFFKSEGLKKTRKQQIQINDKKPDVKRFNQLLQMFNQSKVDFSKQIRDITKIINKSLDTSYAVEKFYKAKDNFQKITSSDELANARKQIEQLRKKILVSNQIALTKQLTQLYHCEIHNRMRSNLVAGNFDLDKNSKLLKFAQEQGIANTSTYFKLKEKFDTKNQKSKEISLIKNIETKLKTQASKQTDPLYKNLYNTRKSLQIPDVQQQMPKISYIQELKQKNKQLKARITKILNLPLNNQTKLPLQQVKALLFEALKSPFNLSNIAQLYLQVQRCHSFYTSWKRSNSLGRNTLYNDEKLKQYQKLKFRVEQLQSAAKEIYKLKNSLKILQTIQNFQDEAIESRLSQNLVENLILMEENIENIEENQLAGEDNQMIVLAKRKYVKIWVNYLKTLRQKRLEQEQKVQAIKKCQDQTTTGVLISAKKIKKLLYDSYFMLQSQLKSTMSLVASDEIINELKQNIIFLEKFLVEIKFNYLEGNYNKNNNVMEGWIDIDEFIYQIKIGCPLDELFLIYKPFEDLNKFKYKNLLGRTSDLMLVTKSSIKEQSFKRPRPEEFNIDVLKQQRPLFKKSSSQFVKNQQSSDQEQKGNSNIVTLSSRKKIKQILSKNILKNSELKKLGTCENQVKMIENQIFGEYHDNLVKYFQTSQKFQKLFIKLQQCPQISKKLVKKQFQFKFIKLLVENLSTIGDIQGLMVSKMKQEQSIQKFNASLQVTTLQTGKSNQVQQKQSTNVLDMLATGNVKEELKKDIANEMKKIKQNKDKKKKKTKHRHRSRSRSASPQAKFSSQSEQEILPSYIQKQYAQQGSKTPLESRLQLQMAPMFPMINQPLMFDPQINQGQIQDLEKKYPRGSTLKIKSTILEFFLKKKGKMQMNVNFYTIEDYKKIISQLVDPGFTSLNIRKQKSDKQILDYLNKPSKKKYKFLISWMEGQDVQSNEILKQLSEEANQRQKIYGWQNDQIKIHVMSIKQFVQLTKFSLTTPNRTIFKECVDMFDEQRIICVIQYPAQKMYELKEKFKNFSQIQRIQETYQVGIPLPSYDTYAPMQTQNPYYPSMGDVQGPNILSIKPMNFDDTLSKQSRPVQFQGWGASGSQTDISNMGKPPKNPYQQTRLRLGFGRFSPIITDQQDNVPSRKEPLPDLADSLLKSFDHKQKFQIPADIAFKNERSFTSQPMQSAPYGAKYPPRPQYNQRPYDNMGVGNPMNPGMNQMRGYNNQPGYQNRGYNQQGYNNMNRYQNQGNQYRQQNYQNQYNPNRNMMPYQQRPNRNPMFNPMNNNPMNNPINNNPMNNQMNPPQNPMQFGQPNQYQNNPRYPPYGDRGNNMGGYPQ